MFIRDFPVNGLYVDENPEYLKTVYNDDEARNIQKPDFAATSNREMQELVTAKSATSRRNPAETNLINKPNTNLNNNVVEIFSEHDIDIRPVLKKHPGIFDDFSAQEISKVARTLKNKAVKGKIQNPVGIILANPDILRTILTGEFYAEKKQAGKAYFSEYTTYVPPDIF
ncbi:hypothetical protein [Syntrophomonas palmitatica]|uniref:hypothetical protein n=1 Tax=Syntrophomonas palmitatica TaxID=402877 RepID=UPI0006D16D51|nr:hypothetical protein [Syntrophomonas palmitatica]